MCSWQKAEVEMQVDKEAEGRSLSLESASFLTVLMMLPESSLREYR